MPHHLYLRYIRSDLRRNRAVTLCLALVLTLSAFLMAGGAIMMERLAGSVGQIFTVAKPPHFLQMHQGTINRPALQRFSVNHPEIEAWQICEMIGFDGQAISWQRTGDDAGGDLSASLIDNLFVTQNRQFDLLLDAGADTAPRPAAGEVLAPVAYQQQFGLQAGDCLRIRTGSGTTSLTITGFVRDAQMASSMSSATRFLVSPADFHRLSASGGGIPESIVEYRLRDTAGIGDLQRAYEADPALRRNGQAVTLVMIRLVNMVSDGLVAIALVFASLLLIVIAMLNVRLLIRATLEDEIHEIATMRTIGLPARDISSLYGLRYGILTLAGCLVGGALAIPAVGAMTAPMRATFADPPITWITVAAPLLALTVVLGIVMWLCRATLRRVRRIDIVDALVHGSTGPRKGRRRGTAPRSRLAGARPGRLWARLALAELRDERGRWVLLPVVFGLTTVLVTVPANVLATFQSPRFVTYMGAPSSDMRADIGSAAASGEPADDAHARLRSRLAGDTRVSATHDYAQLLYQTYGEDGWETIRIEVGDYSHTTMVFLSGAAPSAGQIALSALNADKYGLSVGESISVRRDDRSQPLTVSGIYQDVTSGGYTAKMQGAITAGADRWTVYIDLDPGADPVSLARQYNAAVPGASVIPMLEYVTQTFSYATDALRTASLVTLGLGLAASALITALFLRLRLARSRAGLATLSSIGFPSTELRAQLWLKAVLAVTIGVAAGSIIAATLAGPAVSALLSGLGTGITRLTLLPNPWISYFAYPLLLLTAGALATWVTARQIRDGRPLRWLS
ncbi:MAG: ABC transporter permease [Acidipropionibacterium acidipropionici]|jgi:putative ABC transport system permease protein|uniref:ABC transporter permease n=1 Tax=Acidipropionibacterium acidipropionici TaxID=1748 RepID=UPI002F35EDA4